MPNNISNGFLDQQQFYKVQDTESSLLPCEAVFIAAEEDLRPELRAMLDKMILAVKLQPGATAQILSLSAGEVIQWHSLRQQTGAAYTVVFGVAPRQLQLQAEFGLHQVTSFQNHLFLFASSLESIQQDKNLKAQLWAALQTLFGLGTPL